MSCSTESTPTWTRRSLVLVVVETWSCDEISLVKTNSISSSFHFMHTSIRLHLTLSQYFHGFILRSHRSGLLPFVVYHQSSMILILARFNFCIFVQTNDSIALNSLRTIVKSSHPSSNSTCSLLLLMDQGRRDSTTIHTFAPALNWC